MIRVESVAKSFGDVRAVRDVSFAAEDGQITGLLGPNGAGKSTMLRMLYTVIRPDSGCASIDGIDVVRSSAEARGRLGAMPHGAGLYDRLTARENIAYYGSLHGIARRELTGRVQEIVELLEMEDFADRQTKGFSQRQKTRVALGRALVHGPQNVILDEPTNGLDVMATRALRRLILKLKAAGKCVLLSSHVMQEVTAVCDEIVIMAAGRVAATGSPDSIRESTGEPDLEEAFVQAIHSVEETR